jgi:hypothetical protein
MYIGCLNIPDFRGVSLADIALARHGGLVGPNNRQTHPAEAIKARPWYTPHIKPS